MKTYKVTMTIVDDNLGLERAGDPTKMLRLHISDKNITLDDFELVSVEEMDFGICQSTIDASNLLKSKGLK